MSIPTVAKILTVVAILFPFLVFGKAIKCISHMRYHVRFQNGSLKYTDFGDPTTCNSGVGCHFKTCTTSPLHHERTYQLRGCADDKAKEKMDAARSNCYKENNVYLHKGDTNKPDIVGTCNSCICDSNECNEKEVPEKTIQPSDSPPQPSASPPEPTDTPDEEDPETSVSSKPMFNGLLLMAVAIIAALVTIETEIVQY